MTQPKKHADGAARQQAYRQRLKEAGQSTRGGTTVTLFQKAQMGDVVVYDGEGVTVGEEHYYTMLAALGPDNTYLTLESDGQRLTTYNILSFLAECKRRWARVLHIGFALSYDVIQWLHDLKLSELKEALRDGDKPLDWQGFAISYTPRHEFWLGLGKSSSTIWDIFGFFQCSLLSAIDKWQIDMGDWAALIERGKAARGSFEGWSAADIAEYTRAELYATRRLFARLCRSFAAEDIPLTRYDGAGAGASALLRKHGFNRQAFDAMVPTVSGKSETVVLRDAIDRAYFGGRIEAVQIGCYTGTVYSYDVCSAYPTYIAQLPDLRKGHWEHKGCYPCEAATATFVKTDPALSLYLVRWSFENADDRLPLPFPYRWQRGVFYPPEGYAWLWRPLLLALQEIAPKLTRGRYPPQIQDRWTFTPTSDDEPFSWVRDYYYSRQRLINEKPAGWGGREKVLKLALNSIYGKYCQRYGAKDGEGKAQRPTYYNRAMAGWVTASTQAALIRAAYLSPSAVISLQTDGIFSTEPLPLPLTATKELGLWEAATADELIMVYSGLYYQRRGSTWSEKSRGIAHAKSQKEIAYRIDRIREHWATGLEKVTFPSKRFYGPKLSATGGDAYRLRGTFTAGERDIDLTGGNGKRQSVRSQLPRAADRLIPTYARGGLYGWNSTLSEPAPNVEYDDQTLEAIEEALDELED